MLISTSSSTGLGGEDTPRSLGNLLELLLLLLLVEKVVFGGGSRPGLKRLLNVAWWLTVDW